MSDLGARAAGGGAPGAPRETRPLVWRVAGVTIAPVLRLLIGTRLHHRERIPRTGAFILAPNHTSEVDPVAMAIALYRAGRLPRFLAKASMFRAPVLGAFMRATGMIPVERGAAGGGSPGADPLTAARRLTDEHAAVIIYPEGTLTREPGLWPMRGKHGAARLALRAGVPVIPAAHWGEQRILPRWGRSPRLIPRTTVDVLFGDPVDLSAWEDRPLDDATLAGATEAIMQAITALVAELRGETPPAGRWDPAEHGQSEFGQP